MSREETIFALADQILNGTPGMIHPATIIDMVLDEPLVSNEDAITLLFGCGEQYERTRDRCEKAAEAVVVSWLRDSPRGKALVAERIERERDEEEEVMRGAA